MSTKAGKLHRPDVHRLFFLLFILIQSPDASEQTRFPGKIFTSCRAFSSLRPRANVQKLRPGASSTPLHNGIILFIHQCNEGFIFSKTLKAHLHLIVVRCRSSEVLALDGDEAAWRPQRGLLLPSAARV